MNSSEGNKSKRFWIGCGIFGGIVVCGLGGTGLFFASKFFDIGGASQRATEGAVSYRAAGFAWEANDLEKEIGLTDADNGAALFKQAEAALGTIKTNKLTTDIRNAELVKDWKSVAEQLKPVDRALDLASQASQKKGLDFHRDWDMGTTLLFPEYVNAKFLVRGLCYRALIASHEHQTSKAVTDLTSAWKLAKMMGHEPILIAMLVEIACRTIVLDTLVRCTYADTHSAAVVKQFESVVKDDTSGPDFTFALRGEAYMQLSTIRNLSQMGGIQSLTQQSSTGEAIRLDPSKVIRTGLPKDLMSKAFAAKHFELWVQIGKTMHQYKDQPDKLAIVLDQEMEKVASTKSVSNMLNAILFPVFSQAGVAVTKTSAELRSVRALMAGLEMMDKTGKTPSNVGAIASGKWIDPFTGNPLLLKKQAGGFRIYSVGPNGKDDGGKFRQELLHTDDPNFDIGASYPPIPHKVRSTSMP